MPGSRESEAGAGAMLPGARVSYWLLGAWSSTRHPLSLLLMPLGWLVHALTALKRVAYENGWRREHHAGVPTIVVGNIVAGGGGKSPLVLELARRLQARGRRPAIIARGYGGTAIATPREVNGGSSASEVGDEAVMLARASKARVVVCADRVAAAKLAVTLGADVLISDDGLQHYALARDAEIVVVDGAYGYGNRRCLPAGPLREGLERLDDVDLVLHKNPANDEPGYALSPVTLSRLDGSEFLPPDGLVAKTVAAVAGIGQPESFFSTLEQLGYSIARHPFSDHYAFAAADFEPLLGRTVITTAKDAVRLDPAWHDDVWYLKTNAVLNAPGSDLIDAILEPLLGSDTVLAGQRRI